MESGFSVNEDLLVENLTERSLVAQRMVYDTIKCAGGTLSININKEMMQKCRSAHSAYQEFLEKEKKKNKDKVKEAEDSKRIRLEILARQTNARRLQESAEKEKAQIAALKKKIGK